MKGKERENSTFVYLSVLKERGAEGTGGGEGGEAEVVASVAFCPMALDLFVSGGKIKGETETKRDCAINITQAAECRSKEALKGVGTQTERGRHGGIFMGKNATGLYAALEFRCILFIHLKRGRAQKSGERGMTENENCGGCCCL